MLPLQGTGLSCQLSTRDLSPDHHCVWSMLFLCRKYAGFLLLLLLLKLNTHLNK